jgi:ribosomal protein S5
VSVNRVTKVTKGGRAGFSAIVVVGDENGVGHGLENLKMFLKQLRKVEDAKKNLVKIPLNGQSVPHEQKGKFGVHVYFNSCLSWYRSYCWWSCSFSFRVSRYSRCII